MTSLQVALLTAIGFLLAKRGILDVNGSSTAAKLSFFVFTPALIFSKLAQAVSLQSIAHLWPLLVNMCVSMAVGMLLGLAANATLGTPPPFRKLVLCAVSFGNVAKLPLVFVFALCHDRQALFYRALGERCEHVGVAYVAFNIAVGTVFHFTLAIRMLRPPREPEPVPEALLAAVDVQLDQPINKHPTVSDLVSQRRQQDAAQHGGGVADLAPASPDWAQQAAKRSIIGSSSLGGAAHLELQPRGEQPSLHGRPPQPVPLGGAPPDGSPTGSPSSGRAATSTVGTSSEAADAEEEADTEGGAGDTQALLQGGGARGGAVSPSSAAPALAERLQPPAGRGGGALSSAAAWVRGVNWTEAVPLPTQATFGGILVGCIPAVKALLYPSAPGATPPLHVVAETLEQLGGGLIPTVVPLLGAVLSRGPGQSLLPWRVTLGVVVARLVVLPALMTGVLTACLRAGLHAPDPMFFLVLCLSNATPTAINMQTITVLYKHGEAEMSTLLFWQYLASVATLPAFMWLWLHIIHAHAQP
eukprot:scaffold1.g5248.t1